MRETRRVIAGLLKTGIFLLGVWVLAPDHLWDAAHVLLLFPSMWLLGSIMGTLEKHTLHDSSQRKMLGVGVLLVVLAYLWGALLTMDMFTLNPDWVPHMILVFGLFVLTAPRNVLPNTGTALLGLWRYYHPQETPPHTRKTLHEKNRSTGIVC